MTRWILLGLVLAACEDKSRAPDKLPIPREEHRELDVPPPPPPPPRIRPRPIDPPPDAEEYGGVVGGVVTNPPPPPPPPPPPRIETISPTAMEGQRISGDKNIVPDAATKGEIERSGKTRVVVPVKLCLDDTGVPSKVQILKASGFDAYDAKIVAEMKTWRYKPFMVNGSAEPVCSAITLIYVQK